MKIKLKKFKIISEQSGEDIPDSRFIKDVSKDDIKKIIKQTAKTATSPIRELTQVDKILLKYPSLKKIILNLFTSIYNDYIKELYVVAPKPTTFKVLLRNSQLFYLTYTPKTYIAQISGKKYYLSDTEDFERALQALVNLLNIGAPAGSEGPESETSGKSEIPSEEPSTEETPAEETPEEGEEEVPPQA